MKIFILVDMEGISGICSRAQVQPGSADYEQGRHYMTMDVNACVRGCREGGATHVVVRDVHGTTFNLLWHELSEDAHYIMGESQPGRMPEIETFDGLILLGYHAMAGCPMGILEHTASSSTWQNFWMNGRKSGEIAVDAGIAGDANVPVIMVSGDDKMCEEARCFLPADVELVEVKKGLAIEGGLLLPPKQAHERIQQGAAKAVKNCRSIEPYKVSSPVTMKLELVSRGKLPVHRNGVELIDGRTFEVTADSVQQGIWMIEG